MPYPGTTADRPRILEYTTGCCASHHWKAGVLKVSSGEIPGCCISIASGGSSLGSPLSKQLPALFHHYNYWGQGIE